MFFLVSALALGVLMLGQTASADCGATIGTAKKDESTFWRDRDPQLTEDGFCGKGIAYCTLSQCCSSFGKCQKKDCTKTCQCEYSGANSQCPGVNLLDNSKAVPVAAGGGLCGPQIASCPGNECCTLFGSCSRRACDTSYCISGMATGGECVFPENFAQKPRTRRYELELEWKWR